MMSVHRYHQARYKDAKQQDETKITG